MTNNGQTSDHPIQVRWTPDADTPLLGVGGAADNRVYEDAVDGVALTTSATLVDRDGSESLFVEIVGIPASWTILNLNGGTYNAGTQTWSIQLAGGQDFAGGRRSSRRWTATSTCR